MCNTANVVDTFQSKGDEQRRSKYEGAKTRKERKTMSRETDIDMMAVPGHPDPSARQITVNRRAAACAVRRADGTLRIYWFNPNQRVLSREDAERLFNRA